MLPGDGTPIKKGVTAEARRASGDYPGGDKRKGVRCVCDQTQIASVGGAPLNREHLCQASNNFNLLLHETFGGGFSPTAVLKLRRLARKVARGSVDRTAYSPKYSLSFMSHHAERISLSVVRGVNRAIRSHLATLSARLARA